MRLVHLKKEVFPNEIQKYAKQDWAHLLANIYSRW